MIVIGGTFLAAFTQLTWHMTVSLTVHFASIRIVFLVLDEHFVMAINWTIGVCLFCYCSMQTVVEGHLSCFTCACKVLIVSNSFKLRLTVHVVAALVEYQPDLC